MNREPFSKRNSREPYRNPVAILSFEIRKAMATRTSEICRMCNRGLQPYNIPTAESEKRQTYAFVRSPRAILHIQKKYRNPVT